MGKYMGKEASRSISLGKLLLLKAGIIGIGAYCFVLGTEHHAQYDAFIHTWVRGHQPAAESFHRDGFNVKVENPNNPACDFETWLVYDGKRVEVLEDLMPRNSTLEDTLLKRINNAGREELNEVYQMSLEFRFAIDQRMALPNDATQEQVISNFRVLAEDKPELFEQLGPKLKSYSLDKLYRMLVEDMDKAGGKQNGE